LVMKLVECLVAGIAGAASGTATFVLRGTASSAASVLYSDFEGTTQPGTNIITLDSNGCAEVYVNAYCDMTLKTQAGVTLRTVTVGDSATTVEVISDSFTGVDYSGSPMAVSEPITLAAVLDKWNNSAGANDWKVLVGGVSTNLSSAIAGFTGMFINVKDPAYGATGDGVADDTTPIANAIAAADGGIVFFPPGTYKTSGVSLTEANFHLMGSGAGISKITSATVSADLFPVTDNTPTGIKIVEGLGFESSAAIRYHFLMEEGQNVFFRNCVFDATNADSAISNNTAAVDTVYTLTDCRFILAANTNSAILTGNSTEPVSYVLNNCVFSIASGFTGDVLQGPGMHVTNCLFDGSAVTSGTYYHVDAESSNANGVFIGIFVGNTFIDGGSSGYVFDLRGITAASKFIEDSNDFTGFTVPSAATDQGHIYDLSSAGTYTSTTVVRLGSRKCRSLQFTNAASSTITDTLAQSVAETIVISHSNASNLTIRVDEDYMPPGLEFSLVVLQADGSARDIIVSDGVDNFTESAVPANGRAFFLIRTYVGESSAVEMSVFSKGQSAN
jgi:hypothetical protein